MKVRLLTLVFLSIFPFAAPASERVALVFGLSDYATIPSLDNTVRDARLIAETLAGIGFEVSTAINPGGSGMRDALDAFAFRAETADLALIYFAGHGVEVQGENFLIPGDADVRSNRDIQRQAISLQDLLAAVDKARKMRIIILDSCRDNPFGDLIDLTEPVADGAGAPVAGRGSGGLAVPSPDRGTLVSFAAKDGNVALDGTGENSPFALALAKKITVPGLEISLMFRQVRDEVLRTTFNLQEPHTYGSLSGIPFYLAGAPDRDPAGIEDRRVAWSGLRVEQEQQLAALAETGDTRSMLGLAYMRLNPEAERFDPASAVDYLARAAEAGSPEAQFELAKLYETGVGVAPDAARALDLYRAAAEQDFADALNDLGFLHYQGGLGLPRDAGRALGLFERAADLRHPQAMFNFAALIDDGLIPGKGAEEAASYLYQALRSGSEDVLNILTERPTMFKKPTREAFQKRLREYAFYAGVIDGDFGPATRRGIRAAYGIAEPD